MVYSNVPFRLIPDLVTMLVCSTEIIRFSTNESTYFFTVVLLIFNAFPMVLKLGWHVCFSLSSMYIRYIYNAISAPFNPKLNMRLGIGKKFLIPLINAIITSLASAFCSLYFLYPSTLQRTFRVQKRKLHSPLFTKHLQFFHQHPSLDNGHFFTF